MLYQSMEQIIGNTPLLRLEAIEKEFDLCAKLYAKLESFNPTGSAKDRAALYMLDGAIARGDIKAGATIIEPTSGNTGIGLAAIAAARGYSCIIVMPDTMSKERITLMRAYGARVELSDGKLGMSGAIARAQELQEQIPGSIIAGQFDNPDNAKAHYETTGPEIYRDLDGKIDLFVAGIGTGGTITGCGRYLKENIPEIRIIGIEPDTSPLITKGKAGSHGIQGIGANFIPSVLDRSVIDEVVTASVEESYRIARILGSKIGLMCGISSGAALSIAISEGKKKENTGKNIVALLPDSGDRYLSTELYE